MGKYFSISLIIGFSLLSGKALIAQDNPYSFWSAGLQFRPIIPSNLLQTSTIELRGNEADGNEYLQMVINQRLGYSFGMVIRKNFTQRFAIESGVNYVRRSYQLDVTDTDSMITSGVDFGLSHYEIPLTAVVYIRLGEDLYMNTALGLSLDIAARSIVNGTPYFDNFTAIRKLSGAALANVGVEYRTKDSGSFYVGATYHQNMWPIADTKVNHFRDSGASDADLQTPLSGTYLTLDLRYYFSEGSDGRGRRR